MFDGDSDAEGRFPAKYNVDAVGALVFDDLADKVGCDGKELDFISEPLGSSDCSNVGVDGDDVDAFFHERLDSL